MSALRGADWWVLGGYVLALLLASSRLARTRTATAKDYFLAGGRIPPWLAAVSVLATTQSAATFLGAPDYAYRGDFTYLSSILAAVLAAMVINRILMPGFYRERVVTVYDLLDRRFGPAAVRGAGAMFLLGRLLAGGARLYLAALAVSMMLFGEVGPTGVLASAAGLAAASVMLSVQGGLRSVIWIDLLQFATYAAAAVALFAYLLWRLGLPLDGLAHVLSSASPAFDKLRLVDLSWNVSRPFALPAVLTGVCLLYIASYGLDQDAAQRLLACKDAGAASRGLMASVLAGAPLLALLMATGSLLYLFYHGLGGGPASPPALGAGGGIPLLARFIMTETPPGLRGLATAGVLATAVGSTTSALNAMSSVMVEDFYRPWRFRRGGRPEAHLVMAGRAGVVVTGLATLGVAVASFYWQRSSNAPLLEFVLSVMTFAYAGLLGVFLTALFTRRGNSRSACAGLAVGFATILALQPGLADQLPLFGSVGRLAFPWRLCMGAAVSFVVCFWGRADRPGGTTPVTRPPPEWDARRPQWSGEESA